MIGRAEKDGRFMIDIGTKDPGRQDFCATLATPTCWIDTPGEKLHVRHGYLDNKVASWTMDNAFRAASELYPAQGSMRPKRPF